MIISIAQISLGLVILAFPLVLAFAFSFFFTGQEDDEGISNKDLWAQERKAGTPMTISPSRNLDITVQTLPKAPPTVISQHFEAGAHTMVNPNGSRAITVVCHAFSPKSLSCQLEKDRRSFEVVNFGFWELRRVATGGSKPLKIGFTLRILLGKTNLLYQARTRRRPRKGPSTAHPI